MRQLVKAGVAPFRNAQLHKQGDICLLCLQPLSKADAVLDHCHKSGECRGILHRGCNALLGKIENARPQNGLVDDVKFATFLSNVAGYIQNAKMSVLHPSHKTEEQKRLLKNKRARRARVVKKKETL